MHGGLDGILKEIGRGLALTGQKKEGVEVGKRKAYAKKRNLTMFSTPDTFRLVQHTFQPIVQAFEAPM